MLTACIILVYWLKIKSLYILHEYNQDLLKDGCGQKLLLMLIYKQEPFYFVDINQKDTDEAVDWVSETPSETNTNLFSSLMF